VSCARALNALGTSHAAGRGPPRYPLREALAGTAGQTMITTASLRAVEAKDFELALCSVVPSASYVGASGGDSEDGSASGPAASASGQ
jgi:hypothetical protein